MIIRQRKLAYTLRWIFLIGAISLPIIQQMPIFSIEYYRLLRNLIYLIFGGLSLAALYKLRLYKDDFIITLFSFIIFYVLLLDILSFIINGSFGLTLQMLIPFGLLIVGRYRYPTGATWNTMLKIYVSLVVLMVFLNINYYMSSFSVMKMYVIPYKNQIGPMLGLSSIIVLSFMGDCLKKGLMSKSIGYGTMLVFLIYFQLIMRNRSGIIAFIIIGVIFLIKQKKSTYYLVVAIIAFIPLTIYFDRIFNFIWLSFTLNYDSSSLTSLSAGRIHDYMIAINYLKENFLLGSLPDGRGPNISPHNYILNIVMNYGIFALPLVILYIGLIVFSLKRILYGSTERSILIGLLLAYSLIISMFEYSFPYGPGVSQMILWLTLGVTLHEGN
jgi:hypothetical protein